MLVYGRNKKRIPKFVYFFSPSNSSNPRMSLTTTARRLPSFLHSSPSSSSFPRTFSTSQPKFIPVTLAFDSYPPPSPPSSSNGEEGSKGPLIILHGLYGSKQNWRSLSKSLAKNLINREVLALVRPLPFFLPLLSFLLIK